MRSILVLVLITLMTGCSNMDISNREKDVNIEWYFNQDNTEIAEAVLNEDINEINRLVKAQGYDVNTRDTVEHGVLTYHWTYLNFAVAKGKLKSVKALLDLGADINELLIISGGGSSNLNLASQKGSIEMFELLLAHNITVNPTIVRSPFNDLLLNEHFDKALFDLLIKYGADVNHPKYISGTTPLMTAYDIINHKAIDYLLAHGADPLQIDTFGNSFASLLDRDVRENRNRKTAEKYKKRLIGEYGIQYPIEVSYRKGLEQAIERYEKTTAEEKDIMGASEVQRIEGIREALKTGVYNNIPID